MADYSLKVTIRNGRILDAIREAGFDSQSAFCRANGLNVAPVNALIAMRTRPVSESDGRLSGTAQALCDALCALPDDLWSDEQLWVRLPKNSWEFDISRDQVQMMLDGRSMDEKFESHGAAKLLENLSERQKKVLRKRFFEEKNLDEVGMDMGVTRERIRQIEAKALRRIRMASAGV